MSNFLKQLIPDVLNESNEDIKKGNDPFKRPKLNETKLGVNWILNSPLMSKIFTTHKHARGIT